VDVSVDNDGQAVAQTDGAGDITAASQSLLGGDGAAGATDDSTTRKLDDDG
jgi:hypothetical protein